MPQNIYKETGRTIVADLTLSKVTLRTRGAILRQNVSAMIVDTDPLTETSIAVDDENPFIVTDKGYGKVIAISTPFPVYLDIVPITNSLPDYRDGTFQRVTVNGLYFHNGSSDDKYVLRGIENVLVKCSVIVS